MISINKSLAVIALALIVGCSDKDGVDSTTINSIPEETSPAPTQSSNPVAVDKSQAVDSKTNSSQNQPVVANNSRKTDNSSQNQSVAIDNSQNNSSGKQPVAVDNSKSDAVNNTLIIPGKSVGLITAETTRADLVKIYGESNLKDETILQAEGTVSVPATNVNQGTPTALTIFWKDEARKQILYIRGFGSQWKTPEGIGVGTSLSRLREILGEFKLTGFGWDYGGAVNFKGTK
ncbi:MAG: hypothetical protein AAFS12_05830, partial [Cyanobacteria bacterium J06632_19]